MQVENNNDRHIHGQTATCLDVGVHSDSHSGDPRKVCLKYIKGAIQEGMRFGRLVVTYPNITKVVENIHRRSTASECLCDCGREVVVRNRLLKSWTTLSCGCLSKETHSKNGHLRAGRIEDLSGKVFGRLTVLRPATPRVRANGHLIGQSVVVCSCGKSGEFVVRNCSLKSGMTTSCGCKNRERIIQQNKDKRITGQSNSRLAHIFYSMHRRCESQKHKGYKCYGGKGIQVCPEWDKFEVFYKWALENGYDSSLTIDRIDSDKGYSPNNCRWVTMKDNIRNKRNVLRIEYHGNLLYVSDIAAMTGMDRKTIIGRIKKGWSAERVVETLAHKGNNSNRGIFRMREAS